MKVEAWGWERSSPWALGRSLWFECLDSSLVSMRLRPRNQERERPKVRKTQGPVQKQASSRLPCRQVGRETSCEAPGKGGLSPGTLPSTT